MTGGLLSTMGEVGELGLLGGCDCGLFNILLIISDKMTRIFATWMRKLTIGVD